MAAARLALAALATVLLAGGCGGGQGQLMATPRPTEPAAATLVHVADVRTGMCLHADRLPADGRVAYLEVVDCGLPHTGEVVDVGTDPGDSCPQESRALVAGEDVVREGPAPLVCVQVDDAD